MATRPYLVLTDGTTTITFSDGSGGSTNYPLVRQSWAPRIGALSDSVFGGSQYAPVVEEFTINIVDTTAAGVLSRLETLAKLLDQAERAIRYEENGSTPVVLKYSPMGSSISSTSNANQALVLGRASGDETSGVSLPVTTLDGGMTFIIENVRIRLIRRPLWTLQTALTATSASTNNGLAMSCTLSAASSILAPTKIQLSNFNLTQAWIKRGLFLLTNATDAYHLIEPESYAAGGVRCTSVAEGDASNSAVMRFTPIVGGLTGYTNWWSNTINTSGRMLGVAATVRVNATATTYLMWASGVSRGDENLQTPPIVIASSATERQTVFLGVLASAADIQTIRLNFQAQTNGGTLDVDRVMVFRLDDPNTNVLGLLESDAGQFLATTSSFTIDPRYASAASAVVGWIEVGGTGALGPVQYQGDPRFLTKSAQLYGILFCTGGYTEWFHTNDLGTRTAHVMTITRAPAYLVAQ